jgi:hypothetical protein
LSVSCAFFRALSTATCSVAQGNYRGRWTGQATRTPCWVGIYVILLLLLTADRIEQHAFGQTHMVRIQKEVLSRIFPRAMPVSVRDHALYLVDAVLVQESLLSVLVSCGVACLGETAIIWTNATGCAAVSAATT